MATDVEQIVRNLTAFYDFAGRTLQEFPDYAALAAKMAAQGPESLERIRPLRGPNAISIPMPYRLALL